MQVPIFQTTWHHIPSHHDRNIRCHENLKSHAGNVIVLYILIIIQGPAGRYGVFEKTVTRAGMDRMFSERLISTR
jgi:hypothetical protein